MIVDIYSISAGKINDKLPDIVLMGDSITDERVDGDWVKSFRNIANFDKLRNYARGHCTWTFKADTTYNIKDTSNANIGNNVIWNQYNRLKNDINNGDSVPDAIIILAGTNDLIQQKTLGDITEAFTGSILDKDVQTLTNLAQSIRYTCECIKQDWTSTQLILCTPWAKYGSTSPYRDMIINCGLMLSDGVIDVWGESGIYDYFEQTGNVYKDPDNTHLSALGGQRVAEYMNRQLLNMVNRRG